MRPERKVIIREDAQYEVDAGYSHGSADISNQEVLDLLTTLEDTEQQNVHLAMNNLKLQTEIESVQIDNNHLQKSIDWWDNYSREKNEELLESQQTITRLQAKIDAALSWTWNCSEVNMLEVIAALRDDGGGSK